MSTPQAQRAAPQELLHQILHHSRLAHRLVGRRTPEGEEIAWCLFHPDGNGHPPHSPDLCISEKGYYCFACKAKGSLRQLAEHLGLDSPTTVQPRRGAAPRAPQDAGDGGASPLRAPTPNRRTSSGWISTLKARPCSPGVSRCCGIGRC